MTKIANRYANSKFALDYLKASSDYDTALKIEGLKIDLPEYFNEKKSLYGLQLEGIDERVMGKLEKILEKREERSLKARLKRLREKQNIPPKLNYKKIPSNNGRGRYREDSFP